MASPSTTSSPSHLPSDKKIRLSQIEDEIQRLGNEYSAILKQSSANEPSIDMYSLASKALAFLNDRLQMRDISLVEIYGVMLATEKVIRHVLTTTGPIGEVKMIERFAMETAIKMITGYTGVK